MKIIKNIKTRIGDLIDNINALIKEEINILLVDDTPYNNNALKTMFSNIRNIKRIDEVFDGK